MSSATGQSVVVNEVSDKSIPTACKGSADFVELRNLTPNPVSLTGWTLHDDRGIEADTSSSMDSVGTLAAGEIRVLCEGEDFFFSIGTGDEVSLVNDQGNVVSNTGVFRSPKNDEVQTYQRAENGKYGWSKPTPGQPNVFESEELVVVNEVADKVVPSACGGTAEYIELFNRQDYQVDLGGYTLHDDKGAEHSDVLTFPSPTFIAPGEYKLLCEKADNSFQFNIGSGDTITLINPLGAVVSETPSLKRQGSATLTFQRQNDGTYAFATPTPGANNAVPSSSSKDSVEQPSSNEEKVNGMAVGLGVGIPVVVLIIGVVFWTLSSKSKPKNKTGVKDDSNDATQTVQDDANDATQTAQGSVGHSDAEEGNPVPAKEKQII